jgi:hypothetical protein
MSKKKTASKKPARQKTVTKRTEKRRPNLDEETSALVLAEYLALGDVKTGEVDTILNEPRSLSIREIAITFRMAEVLEVPDAFAMAPKFEAPFRAVRAAVGRAQEATVAS